MSSYIKLLILMFFVCNFIYVTDTNAETIKAASCSQQDVQKAIDAARDGDIVEVPAGEATWTPPDKRTPAVKIENKLITLQGAGIDKTVITDGCPYAWLKLALVVRGEAPFRVTGFTFRGATARGTAAIQISGGSRNWRVDHCKFDYNGVGSAVWCSGDSFGIVDNCSLVRLYTAINIKGLGDASWKKPLSLGTADAVYIEDRTFTDVFPDGATDAYHGGRYVFRYNTLKQKTLKRIGGIGHHGFDSGGYRSTFSCEVYKNTFTSDAWVFGRSRGGAGVIFGNTVTGSTGFYLLCYYRSSDRESMKRLCSGWGSMCDGTNPLDGNEDKSGYPGRDQPGRATDAGRHIPQLLEPVYEWDNTINDADADLAVQDLGGRSFDHIKENRDFCNDTKRPGYKPYPYPHPLQKQWPPLPPTDKKAPTVPGDLAARAIAERKVKLSWKASMDNEGAMGYYVWLNGSKVTTITDPEYTQYVFLRLKPPLEQYTFAVSAFDAAGNESEPTAAVNAGQGPKGAQQKRTSKEGKGVAG